MHLVRENIHYRHSIYYQGRRISCCYSRHCYSLFRGNFCWNKQDSHNFRTSVHNFQRFTYCYLMPHHHYDICKSDRLPGDRIAYLRRRHYFARQAAFLPLLYCLGPSICCKHILRENYPLPRSLYFSSSWSAASDEVFDVWLLELIFVLPTKTFSSRSALFFQKSF